MPRRLPLATAEVPAIQVTTAETHDPSSFATAVHGTTWTDDETRALLEFLLLYRPSDKWPATKNQQFWTSAAEFVELRGNGRMRRSGRSPAPHIHMHIILMMALCTQIALCPVAFLAV